MPRLTMTAVLLIGALSVARADVYRWIDDQGQPHYSDQWVPGSVIIKTDKPHPTGTDTSARSAGQKSLNAANNRAAEQLGDQANSRAVQQDVNRTRDAQCKAAKDRYLKAIESRRVYKEGRDGERSYLSDQEADGYREMARKDVQDKCGSVPDFVPDQPIPEPKAIPEPRPIPEPKVSPATATSE